MAGKKISQLPLETTPTLTDLLVTVQSGATYSITNQQLFNLFQMNGLLLTVVEVTTTSATMQPNRVYVANNASLVSLTLPAVAPLGTIVSVQGKGAGSFKILQNSLQQINYGSTPTTLGTGGSLTADNQWNSIQLICVTANYIWALSGAPEGSFTVV